MCCGGRSHPRPHRVTLVTRSDAKDDRGAGRPNRPVPILCEGVHEAFMAMRQQHDQPGGAVCLNANGRLWRDDSSGNPMIREGHPPADPEGLLRAEGIPEPLDHPVHLGAA
jgi:hypothetical protein